MMAGRSPIRCTGTDPGSIEHAVAMLDMLVSQMQETVSTLEQYGDPDSSHEELPPNATPSIEDAIEECGGGADLDFGTDSDIQNVGDANAAGSTGLVADAGHVHAAVWLEYTGA